jgi:hypothetical protein
LCVLYLFRCVSLFCKVIRTLFVESKKIQAEYFSALSSCSFSLSLSPTTVVLSLSRFQMHSSLCRIHLRLLLLHLLAFKCMRSPSSFSLSLSSPTATLSLSRFHFRLNSGFKAGFRPNTFGFSAPCPFLLLVGVFRHLTRFLFVAFNSDCCSFTFSLSNAFVSLSLSPPTVALSLTSFQMHALS